MSSIVRRPKVSLFHRSHLPTLRAVAWRDAVTDNGTTGQTAVENLNFEDALKELERIVEGLERGQGALDDAIAAYERGALLKKHCQKKLEEARLKVEKIKLDETGQPSGTSELDG